MGDVERAGLICLGVGFGGEEVVDVCLAGEVGVEEWGCDFQVDWLLLLRS